MLVCSVQIISRLESQSKFQMFTLFSGHHIVHHRCTPTWRFHTELCKFLQNISTDICGLGKHTDLKLGEVSSSFISSKIKISCLYPLNSFRFIFLMCDSENDIYLHLFNIYLICLLIYIKFIYYIFTEGQVPNYNDFFWRGGGRLNILFC